LDEGVARIPKKQTDELQDETPEENSHTLLMQ